MSTRPPLGCSVPNMVQRYLGTEYDKVKLVADNIEYVKDVAEAIEGLPLISYIGDEPPVQPMQGAEWFCTTDSRTYVWYLDNDLGQWVESSPQSTIETVVSYIGDKPPAKPLNGAEWYCTTDGRSYVWYEDADSSQWVESSPQSTTAAHKTIVAEMGGVINASSADVHVITDNVAISSISGGFDGQEITLVNATSANVIVNQASNMRMVGGIFTMAPNDTLKFICATAIWFEVSRSSNN